MNDLERARLMHAVLDGEAAEAEARDLDRLLAAEPTARTEFEHLRSLFDGLNRVPKMFPPEGLVAAVLANIPQNSPPQGRLDQLSLRSRVIGLASMKARGKSPGKSATDPSAYQPGIYSREWKMSEQSGSLSRKRNVLIGGGIAIVAALLTLSYTIDFPSGVQNTVGTIVPAQRYKAPQPVIEDIKAGGQGAAQSVPLQAGSATNAAASNAVSAGTANNSVNAGQTSNAVMQGTAANAVNAGTTNAVNAGTTNAVNAGTTNAVNAGTFNAINAGTTNAISAATTNAVNASTSNAVNASANNAVNASANNAVNASTNNAVNASTNNAVNASTNNAVNKSTTNAINAATTNAVTNAVVK
jgi:hypothetical protein